MRAHVTQDQAHRLLLEQISGRERQRLEEHLLWCEDCCRLLLITERYIHMTREIFEEEVVLPGPQRLIA